MIDKYQIGRGIMQRYAWVPLFLFSVVILLMGLGGFAGPVKEGSVLAAYASDDISEQILALRLKGSFVLGMVVFGMAIILYPLRQGERWAWYVLWYYPIFFALHVIAFGTFFPDGLSILISAASLLLCFPKKIMRPTT
ncbi:MAG: hypothetical protein E4G99_09760 [Anaerolineales bacterium]|nr:MAG: hypothetical protein E4G99_09760 [Anaerolineales bacterium]